ncbi:amino acid adenylation domain-containing protein [Actinomycetes bacterium KLBMP 9797]
MVKDSARPNPPPLVSGAANGGDLPLSPRQRRWWFLSQVRPDSPVGTTVVAYRIRGPLHVERLTMAVRAVVSRHSVLRTGFPGVVGQPRPTVAETVDVRVAVQDVTDDAQAADAAARWGREPFDVGRGPLLRCALFRSGARDHLLAVAVHQLVADEQSAAQFVTEVCARYGGDPVAAPSPQYADYVVWQRDWLACGALDGQREYWRQRLADAPAALELPTDHTRPALSSFTAGRHRFAIPELALSSGATALLTGFLLLLGRYTGRDDVQVGLHTDGRYAGVDTAIGPFAGTVVVRADRVAGSFAELSERVAAIVTEATGHGDVPFEQLVEELAPARDLSRNPVVQVGFGITGPHATPALPEASVERVDVAPAATLMDLELRVTPRADGGWDGDLRYATDLFAPATVARMVGAYLRLLAAAAADPHAPVSRLELLPEDDRHQIAQWNATALPVPERTVHELVDARAVAAPDATAVVCGPDSLTYGELRTRANRLAHALRARGVGPDSVVGLCLPRGVDMVVGVLGILAAGGAYLPLHPDDPVDRLVFMVDDGGAGVVVTHSAVPEEVVGKLGRDIVRIDSADVTGQPGDTPVVAVGPEHAAYVIYTSGSTGRPKGVCVPHGGYANLVAWHLDQYRLGDGDRCGQFSRITFDASAWEIGPALAAGATLVVAPDEARATSDTVVEWLAAERITVTFLPVQLAERLFRDPRAADMSLRLLLTGSDRLMQYPPASLPFEVVNHYGPTECSVISTAGRVPGAGGDRPPSIGTPVANTEIHVLDPYLKPVPVGAPGEIYVGGRSIGRGYLNRPGLTAEQFPPDPFSGRPGGRLYRTGDLGRWTPDGVLEFLGRRDNQVKIRGYRIECGEIESCLLAHPQVAEAVVVVRDDSGDKRLVGYVVPTADGGEATTAAALRAHLLRQLPDYMVPASWVMLADLPKNASAKVDRRALPPPRPVRPDLESPYAAPRTAVERTLVAIWSEVLGVDGVGVYDNFFELGGHSLLATKIVGMIERDLAPGEIDLRAVFEYPTIAELAASLAPDDTTVPSRTAPATAAYKE